MKTFTRRRHTRSGKINGTDGDFVCLYCGAYVTSNSKVSGVHNRNHCPYCLTSRHLDLFEAGDRLSACKAIMKPIGLMSKYGNNKYRQQGEIMVVHLCEDCGSISPNRIAKDDNTSKLHEVLESSDNLSEDLQSYVKQQGLTLLKSSQSHLVC